MERYIFHILKGIVLKLQAPVKEPGCKYVISQLNRDKFSICLSHIYGLDQILFQPQSQKYFFPSSSEFKI